MKLSGLSYAAFLLVGACAQDPTPSLGSGSPALAFSERQTDRVSGTFDDGSGERMTFQAQLLGGSAASITLGFRGLLLDATLDLTDTGRVWTQDGFSSDGRDTLMAEEDVAMVHGFVRALEEESPDIAQGVGLEHHLDSVANYWAQWIPVMGLQRIKYEDGDRATSLCYYAQDAYGSYSSAISGRYDAAGYRYLNTSSNWAGHDCGTTWLGGHDCNGDPLQGGGKNNCSSIAQLGDHTVSGSAWGNTYSWSNNKWTSSTLDHVYTYEVGDCYGRYGADCGSGHAYNQENTSHDQCVRNGHNLVSSWCSDELLATTDSTGNCY
jgi:hypothetical protein